MNGRDLLVAGGLGLRLLLGRLILDHILPGDAGERVELTAEGAEALMLWDAENAVGDGAGLGSPAQQERKVGEA